jgi:hypothetical protein
VNHKCKHTGRGRPADDLERLSRSFDSGDDSSSRIRPDPEFDVLWRRLEQLDEQERQHMAAETEQLLHEAHSAKSGPGVGLLTWARVGYVLVTLTSVLQVSVALAQSWPEPSIDALVAVGSLLSLSLGGVFLMTRDSVSSVPAKDKAGRWLGASAGVLVTATLISLSIGGVLRALVGWEVEPTQQIAGRVEPTVTATSGVLLARLPQREGSMTVGPGEIGNRSYPQSLSAELGGCEDWTEFDISTNQAPRWLTTTVGVRSTAQPGDRKALGPAGTAVVFRVLVDGELVGEERLRPGQQRELAYSVAGGRRLRLEAVVGDADARQTNCDSTSVAVWGRPYLSPVQPRGVQQDTASRGSPRPDLLAVPDRSGRLSRP